MARPKRAPVGGIFFNLKEAEQAAEVVHAGKIPAEVTEVSCLMCPGAVRKNGWMLFVPNDDVRRAHRFLEEAGFSHFQRKEARTR